MFTGLIGVVGAGTMGAGIAEVAARAGHPVLLLDVAPGAAAAAVERLRGRLTRDVATRRLSNEQAEAFARAVHVADGVADLASAGLVVEAVREDLTTKRELFAALEEVVDDACLLATNTSSLSVTAVAAGLRRPDRVLGLHFFNPAQRMRLVEVVRADATSDTVVERACALVQAWGKTAVSVTSTPGFIVNRVARPFYGEAQRIVEEGVTDPATVDLVLREAGQFPMGPFELTDLVGQDVNLAVSASVWRQTFCDPRYAPTVFQQRLVDAGRLGRKSGRGVFDYSGTTTGGGSRPPATADAPPGLPPSTAFYGGDWGVMAPLLDRARAAGVDIVDLPQDHPARNDCSDGIGLLLPSGGRLVETTGQPAVTVGRDVVVLDWAFAPESTTRVAVSVSPGCSPQTVAEACGILQAAGLAVTVVGDGPGLVVARTVAMLVNEAADLVARGEATADDVDTAMRLGTGYPQGPLEWGDRIGPSCARELLTGLHRAVPTGRYRACPALTRAALTGGPLHA